MKDIYEQSQKLIDSWQKKRKTTGFMSAIDDMNELIDRGFNNEKLKSSVAVLERGLTTQPMKKNIIMDDKKNDIQQKNIKPDKLDDKMTEIVQSFIGGSFDLDVKILEDKLQDDLKMVLNPCEERNTFLLEKMDKPVIIKQENSQAEEANSVALKAVKRYALDVISKWIHGLRKVQSAKRELNQNHRDRAKIMNLRPLKRKYAVIRLQKWIRNVNQKYAQDQMAKKIQKFMIVYSFRSHLTQCINARKVIKRSLNNYTRRRKLRTFLFQQSKMIKSYKTISEWYQHIHLSREINKRTQEKQRIKIMKAGKIIYYCLSTSTHKKQKQERKRRQLEEKKSLSEMTICRFMWNSFLKIQQYSQLKKNCIVIQLFWKQVLARRILNSLRLERFAASRINACIRKHKRAEKYIQQWICSCIKKRNENPENNDEISKSENDNKRSKSYISNAKPGTSGTVPVRRRKSTSYTLPEIEMKCLKKKQLPRSRVSRKGYAQGYHHYFDQIKSKQSILRVVDSTRLRAFEIDRVEKSNKLNVVPLKFKDGMHQNNSIARQIPSRPIQPQRIF